MITHSGPGQEDSDLSDLQPEEKGYSGEYSSSPTVAVREILWELVPTSLVLSVNLRMQYHLVNGKDRHLHMRDLSEFIGKHILVGLTYVDDNDVLIEQVQFHGVVTRISDEGIFLDRADGKGEFSLPPDVESLRPAAVGNYRLRSSGEVVVNPDYTSSWTIKAPPPSEGR